MLKYQAINTIIKDSHLGLSLVHSHFYSWETTVVKRNTQYRTVVALRLHQYIDNLVTKCSSQFIIIMIIIIVFIFRG